MASEHAYIDNTCTEDMFSTLFEVKTISRLFVKTQGAGNVFLIRCVLSLFQDVTVDFF